MLSPGLGGFPAVRDRTNWEEKDSNGEGAVGYVRIASLLASSLGET
jgi:hypothetical protein